MFDLKLVHGTIVDGTGRPRFVGDVAVEDGLIVAVGPSVEGAAAETIDATGLVITPGFVDIHTHYDGQATWDPVLEPSASHGVTTVVVGNCGVGFAPVRPGQEAMLIEMMEGVEDIPGTALHEGIQWEWETFPEYLDALDRRVFSMDLAVYIPHAALRMYVMGERGATDEDANADDIAEMATHVREAVEAGAIGFSTSRSLNHKTLDGVLVAGTFAAPDELLGLAHAMVAGGGGLFEVVPTGETGDDPDMILGEIDLMARISKETGLDVSFLLVQPSMAPDLYRRQLELMEKANADGARLSAQVAVRAGGMLLGLASYHAFMRRPTFVALESRLSFDELRAELGKPEVKAAILSEADGPVDPRRQFQMLTESIPHVLNRLFVLGDEPDYEPTPESSVAGIAAALGADPMEVLYDRMVDGSLLLAAFTNYADLNNDALAEMLTHPDTVVGLSDGGAHVKMICDASSPTTLLTHWTRDRTRGEKLPLELAVRKQTSATAAAVGLTDRGTIEPGKKADLNVIDLEHLTLFAPRSIDDLPAGGRRIMQDAKGYVATIVSGVVTRRNDTDTGARPGRLVRSGRSPLV